MSETYVDVDASARGYEGWGIPPEEDDVMGWKATALREASTHAYRPHEGTR